MSDLQKEIATFLDAHDLRCDPATRALDLASEFGEVAKEILKGSDYGKRPVDVTADLREELGDLTFSLYALATELDIDLALALNQAVKKYKTRISSYGASGSDVEQTT